MADTFASSTSDLPRPPRRRSKSPSTHPTNPFAAHMAGPPPTLALPSIPQPTGLQEALGISLLHPGPAAPDFNLFSQQSQAFRPAMTWDPQPENGGGVRHYPSDGRAQGDFWQGALQTYDRSAVQGGNDRQQYGHDAQRHESQRLSAWTANRGYMGGYGYGSQTFTAAGLHHLNEGMPMPHPGSAGLSLADGVPLAAGASYAAPYASGNGHQSTAEYGEDYLYNSDNGAASVIHIPAVPHAAHDGSGVAQNLMAAIQTTGAEQSHVRGNGLSGPSAELARMAGPRSRAVASSARAGGNQVLPVHNSIPKDRSGRLSLRSEVVKGEQTNAKCDQPGPQYTRKPAIPAGQEGDHGSDSGSVVFKQVAPSLEGLSPGELGHRVQQATALSVEDIESQSPRATGLERGHKSQAMTANRLIGSQISAPHNYFSAKFDGASNATGFFDVSGTARGFSIPVGGVPVVAPAEALRPGEAKIGKVPVVNLEEEADEGGRQHCLGEALQPSAKGTLQESLPGKCDVGRRLFSSVVDLDKDEGRNGHDKAVTILEKDKPEGALSAPSVEAVGKRCDESVHHLTNSRLPDKPHRLTIKQTLPRLQKVGLNTSKGSVPHPPLANDVAEENGSKAGRSSLPSSCDSPNFFRDLIPLGARGAPAFRSPQLESNSSEQITYAPATARTEVLKMDFGSDGDEARTARRDRAASSTTSGKSRKGRRSRPVAQKNNKAVNERETRPKRTSPRTKAGCSKGSIRERASNRKPTNLSSTFEEEKECADFAITSGLDSQVDGRASRKRPGVHIGSGDKTLGKRSALADGNDDKNTNRSRIPQLPFDDDESEFVGLASTIRLDSQSNAGVSRKRRALNRGSEERSSRKRAARTDGNNDKDANRRSIPKISFDDDEKGSADLASTSGLGSQRNGGLSRKRRGVHIGSGEKLLGKRSARADGSDDKGTKSSRIPQFLFDDELEDDPSHKPSVSEDGSEEKIARAARRSSSGGGSKKATCKRSVFENDDVHYQYGEHSQGEDEDDDSDDDFEALHNSASKRRSTSGNRGAGRKTMSKRSTSSTHEKRSPVIQKRASLRGKTSPSSRKRRAADPSESPINQLERQGSEDDETDADTNSPSQGGGSQGMNIVVKALPVRKKRETRYPDHLWDMMTSDELSTVRLGFIKYYPTPPSNMRAQGRFEQNNMREMPEAMVKALWENELKPWSDRWWDFFTKFGEFVRAKKKQKPRGKNPTVNQKEVDRWAEEFHSMHGDARLPAPEETMGTSNSN